MAVLPILAFFFCSAGPFLFLIFLLRKTYSNIRTRLSTTQVGGWYWYITYIQATFTEMEIELCDELVNILVLILSD